MKNNLFLPILLIVGIVFIAGCTTPTPTPTNTETCGNGVCGTGETTASCPADCPKPRASSLTVAEQKLQTDKVTIASLFLDKSGFVVIHADVSGTPGAVIGFSEVVSGEKTDFPVAVDASKVGSKVHAMLHYDADENGFYTSVDEAVPVRVDGAIVVKPITIIETTPGTPGPTIDMTTDGFSPKTVTIKAGQIVMFKNSGTINQWPASAVHPTHGVYPESGGCIGSAFDACKGLTPGESWSFTFNQKGSWNYHDHLNPSLVGTIKVE